MPTIEFDLTSDSSDLESTLTRVTAGLKKVDSGLDKVNTSNKKTKRSTDGMKDTMGGLKAAAEGVGGSLGGAAGQLEKFAQAGSLLGPVAVALGVVVVGAALVTAGIYKASEAFISLTREAGKSIKELKDFEGILDIPQGDIDNILLANAELDAMGTLFKKLKVDLAAAGIGDLFHDLARTVLIFGLVAEDVWGKIGPFVIDEVGRIIDFAIDPMNVGILETIRFWRAMAEVMGITVPAGVDSMIASLDKSLRPSEKLKENMEKLFDATKDYSDEADLLIARQLEVNKAKVKGVEVVEEETEAIVEQLSWIDLLNEKLRVNAEMEAARLKGIKDEHAARKELYDFQINKEASIANIQQGRMEFEMDFIQAGARLARNAAASAEDIANRAFKDEKKKAAAIKTIKIAAFIADKTAALAMVYMNTAVAISRAAADTGPVGFLASGPAMIAMGGIQAAAVLAQPIPQFAHGGMVPGGIASDHGLISAQPGEGVVSKRGMRSLGSDGLNSLNSGQSMNNRIVVQNVYKHKVFDSFIQDNISKGGPLYDAMSTKKVGQR